MPAGGLIPDSPWIYAGQRLGGFLRSSGSRGLRGGGRSYFHYKVTNVVIYTEKLRIYLNTQAGPLWGYLHVRGQKAVDGAKRMVGVRTGALRKSIHMKHLGNVTGQYLWIGSQKNYALAHHNGTAPHIITPNPPNTKLVFMGRGGRVIATPRVMHPGNKPNPYLTTQLRHFR